MYFTFSGSQERGFSSSSLPHHLYPCLPSSGPQLVFIDYVMWSSFPPRHTCYLRLLTEQDPPVPLFSTFWNYLFLLIPTITILVQATIISWNSLIQSPCFSVLVLGLISFILAPEYLSYLCHCITETVLSPFLFPGLEDKIGPHFRYRVNISGMSTDEATSSCSSGLQVVTWELHA